MNGHDKQIEAMKRVLIENLDTRGGGGKGLPKSDPGDDVPDLPGPDDPFPGDSCPYSNPTDPPKSDPG